MIDVSRASHDRYDNSYEKLNVSTLSNAPYVVDWIILQCKMIATVIFVVYLLGGMIIGLMAFIETPKLADVIQRGPNGNSCKAVYEKDGKKGKDSFDQTMWYANIIALPCYGLLLLFTVFYHLTKKYDCPKNFLGVCKSVAFFTFLTLEFCAGIFDTCVNTLITGHDSEMKYNTYDDTNLTACWNYLCKYHKTLIVSALWNTCVFEFVFYNLILLLVLAIFTNLFVAFYCFFCIWLIADLIYFVVLCLFVGYWNDPIDSSWYQTVGCHDGYYAMYIIFLCYCLSIGLEVLRIGVFLSLTDRYQNYYNNTPKFRLYFIKWSRIINSFLLNGLIMTLTIVLFIIQQIYSHHESTCYTFFNASYSQSKFVYFYKASLNCGIFFIGCHILLIFGGQILSNVFETDQSTKRFLFDPILFRLSPWMHALLYALGMTRCCPDILLSVWVSDEREEIYDESIELIEKSSNSKICCFKRKIDENEIKTSSLLDDS